MRAAVLFVLVAGCGLPEVTSEQVFGRDKNPKAWAFGTVIDVDTRGPIAGASVNLSGVTQTTDDNGGFTFASVAIGDAEFAVSKAGYEALGQPYRLRAGANRLEITLKGIHCGCTGGQVCDVTTRGCVAPATISGIVTDGCTGAALVAKININGVAGCTDNGPKASWQLTGLNPGGPQTLSAGRPGYKPFAKAVTLTSGYNVLDPIVLERVGGCATVPPAWACQ